MRRFVKRGTSLLTSFIKDFNQVSRLKIYQTATGKLQYKKNVYKMDAKNIDIKTQNKAFGSLPFLKRYVKDRDEFLHHIVTGDEASIPIF